MESQAPVVIRTLGTEEHSLRNNYDAVQNLVSQASDGGPEFEVMWNRPNGKTGRAVCFLLPVSTEDVTDDTIMENRCVSVRYGHI